MSCYCKECADIREVLALINKVDLFKLCTDKEPDDFEVAKRIVTAGKHLKDAQAYLHQKHVGVDGGEEDSSGAESGTKSGTKSGLTPSLDLVQKTSPCGNPDNAMVLHEKRNSGDSGASSTIKPLTYDKRPTPLVFHNSALAALRAKGTAGENDKIQSPNTYDGGPKSASPTRSENSTSPAHLRQFSTASSQVTNPYELRNRPVPEKYESAVRDRAAELGILRGINVAGTDSILHDPQPSSVTHIHDTKDPVKEKSRFIVCDHCRAHGLRCNEATICKECVTREVACTHRQCDLSPGSKDACPRQICYYVHSDWMPNLYGIHDPSDPNWIVLPGKLRDHLSAGQLGKLKHQSEAELVRCYNSAGRRQRQAVIDMTKHVQSGHGSWELVNMACACVELEYEEHRARQAEENIRRMQMSMAGGMNNNL